MSGTRTSLCRPAVFAMPTRGGGNFANPAGPFEQTTIDRRKDVYIAATSALTEPLELVGSPRAFLWAASATDDVDVVVRFEQVTQSGKVVAFADGVRRGRFVRGYDALRPLTAGEPALFEIELGPIALRVTDGAALRVAISGASAPRYEPNPNRALPLLDAAEPIATTLSIYRDPEHPSRIELPVLHGALPEMAMDAMDASTAIAEPARDATMSTPDAGSPAERASAHGCELTRSHSWTALGVLAIALTLALRRTRTPR